MGIFTKYIKNTSTRSTTDVFESASSIMGDYNSEVALLENQLYVADAIITRRVLLEGANQSILVEGTIKETIAKVKAAMIKFKNKIVAWFKELIEWFKMFATSNKKFIAKWESKIREKVKQTGYKGKEIKGIIDYEVDEAYRLVLKIGQDLDTYKDYDASQVTDGTKAEMLQKIVRSLKATAPTTSGVKQALNAIGTRNGSKKTITLSAGFVDTLIKNANQANDVIKNITKQQESAKKAIDESLKQLNKMETKEEDGNFVKNKIGILNACNSLYIAGLTTVSNLYKAEVKQTIGLLKKVMVTKVSESLEDVADEILNDPDMTEEDIDAIVEAAIEIEGDGDDPYQVDPTVDDDIEDAMDEEVEEDTTEEDGGEPEEGSVLAEAAMFL